MPTFQYLSDNSSLAKYCQQQQTSSYLALDTEFFRERTYYPKLSLIQAAAQGAPAIIDTLTIDDFSPLKALLENSDIEKIMHDPEQDIEVLEQTIHSVPQPIYDTQLAAAFLGYKNQVSYKDLLADLLDVHISKSYTRSSWLERPLSDGQIQYALEDVNYLEMLKTELNKRLQSNDKYAWFIEEMKQKSYTQLPYWERMVNKYQLPDKKSRTRLRQLAQWREKVARQKNYPRQWIMSDKCLFRLAENPNLKELLKEEACKQIKRYSDELNKLLDNPQEEQSKEILHTLILLTEKERTYLKALQVMTAQIADKYAISPTLLANKKQLVSIVRHRHYPFFTGWRATVMNNSINEILDQELAKTV